MDTLASSSGSSRTLRRLHDLVDRGEQSLRQATDSGDAKVEALRLKSEAQLMRLRMELDDLGDKVASRTRHVLGATNRAVHTHPYRTAGLASAVSLLAGVLVVMWLDRRR